MKSSLFALAILVSASFCSAQAQTQGLAPYEEHEKFIRSAQEVSPLTSDLFGDQISLYNGSTEFVVTDIDLPGNNGLPVQLRRRFKVEPRKDLENLGGFGVWDLDIPYVAGNFDDQNKWNVGDVGSTGRCSKWSPKLPAAPFGLEDVYSGVRAHIPGVADTDVLNPQAGNPNRPTDGAAYPHVGKDFISFSCVAATKNGYPGEGFVAVTADGRRYTFDVGVERKGGVVKKTAYTIEGPFATFPMGRTQVFLLIGRIEDRFGNWVSYDYNGGQLASIQSSDGRRIDLTYSGNTIVQATANGRVWTYQYTPITFAFYLQSNLLSKVVRPDSSAWTYQYEDSDGCSNSNNCMLTPIYTDLDVATAMDSRCPEPAEALDVFTLRAGHPSGASGEFRFGFNRLHRTKTPENSCLSRFVGNSQFAYELKTPDYFDLYSIDRKTISGPGIAAETWTYGYQDNVCRNGVTCPTQKTVTVNQPDGTRTEQDFGTAYGLNDGRLLASRVISKTGSVARSEVQTYVSEAEAPSMPFPDFWGSSYYGPDDPASLRLRPVKATVITQDGASFSRTINSFDALMRPTSVTRSSSLGYSRTEQTEYLDYLSKWVLGQVKKVTKTAPAPSVVVSQTDYDAAYLPWRQYSFGKLQNTLTYYTDGTLATVKDGKNNTTTLSNWKRGIPQTILYADSTTQTASVDDNGWIRSIADENAFTTSYGYDAMGRLSLIDYPDNDSVNWLNTTSSFESAATAEYGLPAGHWKHTVSTGNARKVLHFDAMWRPVVEESYDNANAAATRSLTVKRYDEDGRVAFQSYPRTTLSSYADSALTGVRTSYDALGRATQVDQDSEFGVLTTKTEYLAAFKTRVTNPRLAVTTTSYMAFDQPATDWPVAIAQPEGANVAITRDIFGKPTALKRHNADSSVSLTRNYVYDDYQQLCETIEPETGATLMGYDAAGNLSWSAAGLASTTACEPDGTSTAVAARKAVRSYDTRNRLSTLAFPDGLGNQAWIYTPDGLPERVTAYNAASNGEPVVNAFTYNKRRLLIGESAVSIYPVAWGVGYSYNVNGHLQGQSYPTNLYVDYAPNALGQPTKAGTFATGVSYYPNGAIKQFTYGNGVVHSMTQNARQLPQRSTSSNGVLNDLYNYDANGNVDSVIDERTAGWSPNSRWMTYDGLDRLTGAGAGMFGGTDNWHRFSYDVLDNIKSWKLAGVKDYANYYYEPGSNHLTNIQNTAGASIVGLGYDPQGNLKNKNGQNYDFDFGNRLRKVTDKETYRYDGYGRRAMADTPSQGYILSMYGQSGPLLYTEDFRPTGRKASEYVYLGGSLVGIRERNIDSGVYATKYQHTVAGGGYRSVGAGN